MLSKCDFFLSFFLAAPQLHLSLTFLFLRLLAIMMHYVFLRDAESWLEDGEDAADFSDFLEKLKPHDEQNMKCIVVKVCADLHPGTPSTALLGFFASNFLNCFPLPGRQRPALLHRDPP